MYIYIILWQHVLWNTQTPQRMQHLHNHLCERFMLPLGELCPNVLRCIVHLYLCTVINFITIFIVNFSRAKQKLNVLCNTGDFCTEYLLWYYKSVNRDHCCDLLARLQHTPSVSEPRRVVCSDMPSNNQCTCIVLACKQLVISRLTALV